MDYKAVLLAMNFHMAFTQDFLSFQRQQLFAQTSVVLGSLLQVHFILVVCDQKTSCFQKTSDKVGLTATVVFLTLLNSSPSFEAVTHCVRGVQYFCLSSLFGSLLFALATQLVECHIRVLKSVSIILSHFRPSEALA